MKYFGLVFLIISTEQFLNIYYNRISFVLNSIKRFLLMLILMTQGKIIHG